jgi:hypothetical protein
MSVKIPVMSDHHHDHDERQHAGHEHGAQGYGRVETLAALFNVASSPR